MANDATHAHQAPSSHVFVLRVPLQAGEIELEDVRRHAITRHPSLDAAFAALRGLCRIPPPR